MGQALQIFYDKHNSQGTYGISDVRRERINTLVNSALKHKKARILDVGCSSGYVSSALKEAGHYVVGVDISDNAISKAKKVLDEAYVVDVEDYTWIDNLDQNSFDLIIAAEIFEHLFDQHAFLEHLKKLLTPEGRIIISTPNLLLWTDRIRMLLGTYQNRDMAHISTVSYSAFKKICATEGLYIEREEFVWKPGWTAHLGPLARPNLFAYQIVVSLTANH